MSTTISDGTVMQSTINEVAERFAAVGMSTAVAELDEGAVSPRVTTAVAGTADRRTGEPMHASTLLSACSMSKMMTAVTVLRLVDLGELTLDTEVNDLLQGWQLRRPAGGRITLAHLLAHHGGITDAPGSFEPCSGELPTNVDVLRGLTATHRGEVVATGASGADFSYSDAGYCVIEQIVTDVTGQPFPTVVASLVLEPLGLTSMAFDGGPSARVPSRTSASAIGTIGAVGHTTQGPVVAGERPVYAAQAAAGLWTSAHDLAALGADLLAAAHGASGHLLRPETVTMAWSGQFGTGYAGLGFFLGRDEVGPVVQSHGWGAGFQGMLRFWPTQRRVAAVLMNQDPGCDQESSAVGAAIDRLARV